MCEGRHNWLYNTEGWGRRQYTLIDTQGCGGELIFKRTSFVYFIPGHYRQLNQSYLDSLGIKYLPGWGGTLGENDL